MPDTIHEPLSDDERDTLCRLFAKATGLTLRIPPIDRPDAWMSEFAAAACPPLRALEQAAATRLSYQRGD